MGYHQFIDVLRNNSSFRIVSHMLPDGDSIGSSLALARVLLLRQKNVKVYFKDMLPLKYKFLLSSSDCIEDLTYIDSAEVLLVLDCSDFSRTGLEEESIKKFSYVVNLDHHVTNNYFGNINLVDGSAAATGELLFHLFDYAGITMNQKIAEALYTAILTDTGSFKYQNTTSTTHEVAAKLLDYKIDHSGISQRIFDEQPLSYMLLLKKTLSTLELWHGNQVACLTINEEMRMQCGASMEDLNGIVNYAKNIQGTEIGVLLYLNGNGEIKVGLRSKEVDVSKLAEAFGGGGHQRAAGFKITTSYQEAKDRILEEAGLFLSK